LARDALEKNGIKISKAKVTVLGIAYKKDINDSRETPSQTIVEELINQGAKVVVYDPWVNSIKTKNGELFSAKSFDEAIKDSDCLIYVTDHTAFMKPNWAKIKKEMSTPIVVDSRNMFNQEELIKKGFTYRGIGKPLQDKNGF
jgi:UDP-N-acetyl-D-mannosaminuronate dehydrogenase